MPFFQTALIAPMLGEIAGMIAEANDASPGKKRAIAASTTAVSAAVIGTATVDPGGALVAGVAALAQAINENGSIIEGSGRWSKMGEAYGNLLMGG